MDRREHDAALGSVSWFLLVRLASTMTAQPQGQATARFHRCALLSARVQLPLMAALSSRALFDAPLDQLFEALR